MKPRMISKITNIILTKQRISTTFPVNFMYKDLLIRDSCRDIFDRVFFEIIFESFEKISSAESSTEHTPKASAETSWQTAFEGFLLEKQQNFRRMVLL